MSSTVVAVWLDPQTGQRRLLPGTMIKDAASRDRILRLRRFRPLFAQLHQMDNANSLTRFTQNEQALSDKKQACLTRFPGL